MPDLVVLDLHLPKVDGIEILEAMRRSIHFSNVPVIITSSDISPRDRARMDHFQVSRYFIKPLHLEEFFQFAADLKEVLARRPGQLSTTA